MLRHSAGFSLANRGYGLRLIQDYLGHALSPGVFTLKATKLLPFGALAIFSLIGRIVSRRSVESRSDAVEFRQAVAETGPFGRRCLSILPCSPFPLPAHQTGRADFPHPAFRSGLDVTHSAEPSSHIQTGLAVPHAILVARPLANRSEVSSILRAGL